MPIRAWFPTFIYCEPLQKVGLARLNDELADECRRLRAFDAAGRRLDFVVPGPARRVA